MKIVEIREKENIFFYVVIYDVNRFGMVLYIYIYKLFLIYIVKLFDIIVMFIIE